MTIDTLATLNMNTPKLVKSFRCHGGTLGYYEHQSEITATPMSFTLFQPQTNDKKLLVFLSGLTCTADNFTTKASAYAKASKLGLCILVPDTSPRGTDVADVEAYDLGQGASFYINANQKPWAAHFQMESYIIAELIPLTEQYFQIGGAHNRSISGHSMGGHGALTLHLKYPGFFTSCSAFAPIVAPSQVPWGQKAFQAYLGDDKNLWRKHDACELVGTKGNAKNNYPLLIDQGEADTFLAEQLQPQLFLDACKNSGQALQLRMQPGYDHSYFFIQSFIDDHLQWHHNALTTQWRGA